MTTPTDSIVIDTHPLVWYFENSPRLSNAAGNFLDSIQDGQTFGIIPTIVLAEVMHISERRRTSLSFNEVLALIQQNQNYGIASLNLGTIVGMRDYSYLELHDRIIVSTARLFGAKLITMDEAIRNSGLVECLW